MPQDVKYNVFTRSRKFFRTAKRLPRALRPEHQPVLPIPHSVIPLPECLLSLVIGLHRGSLLS